MGNDTKKQETPVWVWFIAVPIGIFLLWLGHQIIVGGFYGGDASWW